MSVARCGWDDAGFAAVVGDGVGHVEERAEAAFASVAGIEGADLVPVGAL